MVFTQFCGYVHMHDLEVPPRYELTNKLKILPSLILRMLAVMNNTFSFPPPHNLCSLYY